MLRQWRNLNKSNYYFIFYFHFKQPKLVHHVNVEYETATFGMGCFWSADSLYGATFGVLRTKVGYSGGSKLIPKYKNV